MYKLEKFSKLRLEQSSELRLFLLIRDIAQLGRAPALGAGCRRFKSYYPEIEIYKIKLRKEALQMLMEFNLFFILFTCQSEI